MAILLTGFIVFVLVMLALDLGVFNKKAHVITASEALVWTCLCVVLAMIFNVGVYYIYDTHFLGMGLPPESAESVSPSPTTAPVGATSAPSGAGASGEDVLSGKDAAMLFFTGYVIEQSLSLDNVFVIALIFAYFGVPSIYQHRVLFWGILGALVMRGAMIGIGAALIQRFEWITYLFGAILIFTAVKMMMAGEEKVHPEKNPLVRLARRFYPVSEDFIGEQFFTRINGRTAITPLLLVLLVVESTDLLFAVDSIPAIFAITHDPFIVFTSNVFAILGLRSLYFVLAAVVDKFRYLKMSLVFVLAFVGVKMLGHHYFTIDPLFSLAVVAGILVVGVIASVLATNKTTGPVVKPVFDDIGEVAEFTLQQIRRGMTILIGATVVLIGIAMIVLPGPAIVVIPAGLAILGSEFVWARTLLKKLKAKVNAAAALVGFSVLVDSKEQAPEPPTGDETGR